MTPRVVHRLTMCNARGMTDREPKYIPTAEVCARLGIDKSTVSRWVASGKLTPALRSPAAMWFDPADIDRLKAELDSAANGANA